MIRRIKKWWQSLWMYVIADPSDNSITMSKTLFRHIVKNSANGCAARVFVFRIPSDGTFGFMVDPEIGTQTQMCDIQYNNKYKCVGFETLCPSVGRIFYDYKIYHMRKVCFPVSVHKINEKIYYKINKP